MGNLFCRKYAVTYCQFLYPGSTSTRLGYQSPNRRIEDYVRYRKLLFEFNRHINTYITDDSYEGLHDQFIFYPPFLKRVSKGICSHHNLLEDGCRVGDNLYPLCCKTDIKCFLIDVKTFRENALSILVMIRRGQNDPHSNLYKLPHSILNLIVYQYLFAGPKK